MSLPWLSQKAWAAGRLGHPVFRVPVDPGWGCPNRDASGRGGCTFCAEDGGRARQLGDAEGPAEQVRRGAAFARERYGAKLLQLYVQAYTATYAGPARFRELVEGLLALEEFQSVSLGTRPDCLSEAVLGVLRGWNAEREVWVELGVQTVHDGTLKRIGRGHTWARSREAVMRLDAAGLRPCVHLLFGLPGEGRAEMLETVRQVAALPVHGIKFHNLHVLRDAPMGREWLEKPFEVMGEETYLELLAEALRLVPAEVPVMRLVTDSPPEERLAPPRVWSKGRFLHELEGRMRARGWRQGDDSPGSGAVASQAPAR